MEQSRLESAVEAVLNVGSGFFVALFVWQLIIAPIWGYDITLLDNLGLTTIFTAVSIIRSYIWRRFFERRIKRRLQAYAKR